MSGGLVGELGEGGGGMELDGVEPTASVRARAGALPTELQPRAWGLGEV